MKILGSVLAVVGGLMVLSALRLALTEYDLNSSHDLSKLLGALGVSGLMLLGGIALLMKARSKRSA